MLNAVGSLARLGHRNRVELINPVIRGSEYDADRLRPTSYTSSFSTSIDCACTASFVDGPIENELKLHSNVLQLPLKPAQVPIKVHSAAVNPIDYKLVEFMGQMMLGTGPSKEHPFNIGFDAAGEVVEVGSDVKHVKGVDAVYVSTPMSSFGTLAEYVIVDKEFVSAKPSNLDFNETAAVPSVALTAYAGMTSFSKLQKGETVLILGGSTSVGMFAIQFAHEIGVRVIATTSTRNVELVESLGADQVIDNTKDQWSVVFQSHSVDVVYDCGVEPTAWNDGAQSVLKKNTGRFITLMPMTEPVKESKFGAQFIGFVSNPDSSAKALEVVTRVHRELQGQARDRLGVSVRESHGRLCEAEDRPCARQARDSGAPLTL